MRTAPLKLRSQSWLEVGFKFRFDGVRRRSPTVSFVFIDFGQSVLGVVELGSD